ncbi:hypothetical protein [Streptomyces scopuliridis]|uniref:Uncharacterized protein n=1 Tax=Streptomyces scopuliridis RB72 TaxID=1440053 RepID=A0A2T7TG94_9ACTN|nr:hypothetical protein [Streptomyces scopuliridis]PVE14117.1 hypothetical protein Y717_25200 [Streptomyces scopuliridis RB72]
MQRSIRLAIAAPFLACLMSAAFAASARAAESPEQSVTTATLEKVIPESGSGTPRASAPDEPPETLSSQDQRKSRIPKESPQTLKDRAELSQKFRAKRAATGTARDTAAVSPLDCQQMANNPMAPQPRRDCAAARAAYAVIDQHEATRLVRVTEAEAV